MGQGAREANTPVKLELLDKHMEWLELRRQGLTYQAIGDRFGVTKQAVWDAVNRRVQKVEFEHVDAYREYELELLGVIQEGIMQKCVDGDLQAIDRLLRLSERRSRLLGLDRPVSLAIFAQGQDAPEVEPMQAYKSNLQKLLTGEDDDNLTITAS